MNCSILQIWKLRLRIVKIFEEGPYRIAVALEFEPVHLSSNRRPARLPIL